MPQAATLNAPLQIFKPGRHTAMGGEVLSFSEADLRATVAAYNPAKHEAPLVVGHPRHDLPAYGWVQALGFSEGGLDATPAQVNTDFADMVAAGAFKKISASFYSPDAANNPVPGVYYLRHVGFLGAQAPAVKGLRQPSFADDEAGVLTFSEWDDVDHASLWRNLREWFIGKFGQAEADTVIPGNTVKSLEQNAQDQLRVASADATGASAVALPLFSEPATNKESTVTEEEAAQLRTLSAQQATRIAELEAAQTAAARAAVHARNVAFCEDLKAPYPAAHNADVVATLDHLDTLAAPPEFGEGDARAPLGDKLREMLKALPPMVAFGETATAARAGAAVDVTNPEALAAAATEYQANAQRAGRTISHAHAVSQVARRR